MRQRPPHVLRAAVDGPDTAGKTTLADALAAELRERRTPIRVSVDGFHRPRALRYRRGPLSPEGYFDDSFDHDAIRRLVLEPLGPGGDRTDHCDVVIDNRDPQRPSVVKARDAAGER